VPLAFVGVHGLILWFGSSLVRRGAPALPPEARQRRAPHPDGTPEIPAPHPPTAAQRIYVAVRNALRWVLTIGLALLVIGVGENLAILHRLDAALAPHRAALTIVFGALLATGFCLFMGGIINLVLHGRAPDGQISLRELNAAWWSGAWRNSSRIRRFLVILSGVVLAMGSGAALMIAFAPPGLKFLVILALAYASLSAMRSASGSRRRSGAAPRARS
jgi:hypothetical protein